MDASWLAHVVSCRRCLEYANKLLGLASLEDRSPYDVIVQIDVAGQAACPRFAVDVMGTPTTVNPTTVNPTTVNLDNGHIGE
jgi:hypothetical protein